MRTIANFLQPDEAHFLHLKLEACGIRSFVQDENTTQLNPWRMWATGGVRVQVADEDLEAAQMFLERERNSKDSFKPQMGNDDLRCLSCDALMPMRQVRCAACGWSYEKRG